MVNELMSKKYKTKETMETKLTQELLNLREKYNLLVTKHNELCDRYNSIPKFIRGIWK
jgi:hypothetical protein